jgi:DNA-binding response OmpR family regulator
MKRTVLLVDDDKDEYEFFCHALERYNQNVSCIHAYECNEIENLVKGKEIHWVFLDFNMPKLNGYQCLNEIKKISALQNAAVYMFSASNISEEIKNLCIEAGTVKWIIKLGDYQGYF